MDHFQMHRREVFGPFVTTQSRGLEIGAGYRPTFAKRDGYNVVVVDHCNTADLIAKHDANIFVPKDLVAQIEEVDIVCADGAYSDLHGFADSFDYVAACHVIEHAVDVCGFLKDCSRLLKPGGYLLLAIPDRSCIEDFYRPSSTLGDVLLAHVAPHAYDIKAQMDQDWYTASIRGALAWSRATLQDTDDAGAPPLPVRDPSFALSTWASIAGKPVLEKPYRDAHRWVFDQKSFEELVRFLELAAGIELRLVSMPSVFECEFYAILQKAAPANRAAEALETARLASFRERRPMAGKFSAR